MRRLNLDEMYAPKAVLTKDQIVEHLPPQVRASAISRLREGGRLGPKSFDAVVEIVRRLAPDTESVLARFGRQRAAQLRLLSDRQKRSLADQQHAVITALSMADLPRESLQDWSLGHSAQPQSFLDGLFEVRLREDPMVQNDLLHLLGHDLIKTTPFTSAVFEGKRVRLTILVTNRQPLEEQLGTDLIYFNETFASFIMVQYKAMEKEGPRSVFRLPNSQLASELTRMERTLTQLRACERDESRDGFRLHDNPFYLKLCPRVVFEPDDVRMIPGMYIPLDYWHRLVKHEVTVGVLGGRKVTFDNVGRYLRNSQFVTLVGEAWVGTTTTQSDALRVAIRSTLESGKAVALAIKSEPEASR